MFILLGVAAYRQWVLSVSPTVPVALLSVYMIGLLLILRNYRFVRLKEAETVFALIFKHRLFLAKSEPEYGEEKERTLGVWRHNQWLKHTARAGA